MESEPMLTPRKNPLNRKKFSPEEDRTQDAASSRTASPTHYQRAIPALGKWNNKTNELGEGGWGGGGGGKL